MRVVLHEGKDNAVWSNAAIHDKLKAVDAPIRRPSDPLPRPPRHRGRNPSFLYEQGANILHADEHQDNELGLFFMRIEWDLDGFALDDPAFRREFQPLAEKFSMRWNLAYAAVRPAVAIFVSRAQHCLLDLLYRHETGELACHIPLIISNHGDARRSPGSTASRFITSRPTRKTRLRRRRGRRRSSNGMRWS